MSVMKVSARRLSAIILEVSAGRKMSAGVASIIKKLDNVDLTEFEVSAILSSAQKALKALQSSKKKKGESFPNLEALTDRADAFMTGGADWDELDAFRSGLESLATDNTRSLVSKIVGGIGDVSNINSEIETGDFDEDEDYVDKLRGDADHAHLNVMSMLEDLWAASQR